MNDIKIKSADDKFLNRDLKRCFKEKFNAEILHKIKSLNKIFLPKFCNIIYDKTQIYFIYSDISILNNENIEYLIIDLYSDNKDNLILANKTISFLLYKTFIKNNFQKLSLKISSDNLKLKDYALKYRFSLEGNLKNAYNIFGIKSDELILSLSISQFTNYSVGYYKIANRYLEICGSHFGIYSINVSDDKELANKKYIEQSSSIYFDRTYSKVKIAIKELDEYFNNKRSNFDLNLEIYNYSDFQNEVWEIAKKIPFGEVYSYEEVAAKLSTIKEEDLKKYSRAVGTALSKNPILILIPCHRVIGKDGKLKGFAAGVQFKDFLLNHEMLKI